MLSLYLYNLCRFSLSAILPPPPPKKERLIVGHCFAERSFVVASHQFHSGLNDVTSGVCCKMAAHDAALHF